MKHVDWGFWVAAVVIVGGLLGTWALIMWRSIHG